MLFSSQIEAWFRNLDGRLWKIFAKIWTCTMHSNTKCSYIYIYINLNIWHQFWIQRAYLKLGLSSCIARYVFYVVFFNLLLIFCCKNKNDCATLPTVIHTPNTPMRKDRKLVCVFWKRPSWMRMCAQRSIGSPRFHLFLLTESSLAQSIKQTHVMISCCS